MPAGSIANVLIAEMAFETPLNTAMPQPQAMTPVVPMTVATRTYRFVATTWSRDMKPVTMAMLQMVMVATAIANLQGAATDKLHSGNSATTET